VKLVVPDTPVEVEHFHRECQILARLRHPGIAPLLDHGQVESFLYFVQAYEAGDSLFAVLARSTRFSGPEVLHLASQLLSVLGHAHSLGVIHRDVKPSNIILLTSRELRLIDFGMALARDMERVTLAGEFKGTIRYASPEQILGRELTPASDLYSAGLVLYECLSGVSPFRGQQASELIHRQLNGLYAPITELVPDAPFLLVKVMAQLLSPEPSRRSARTAEIQMLEDLSRATGGGLVTEVPLDRGAPGPRSKEDVTEVIGGGQAQAARVLRVERGSPSGTRPPIRAWHVGPDFVLVSKVEMEVTFPVEEVCGRILSLGSRILPSLSRSGYEGIQRRAFRILWSHAMEHLVDITPEELAPDSVAELARQLVEEAARTPGLVSEPDVERMTKILSRIGAPESRGTRTGVDPSRGI
jgi:serine/threonine protein kinase